MENEIKVWDIGVRMFHWSLVVCFFIAYITGEEEDLIHTYSGYAVIGLITFRIVWGFIGTKYARFSDFIYGPAAVMAYARSLLSSKPIHYIGHNPLGGWMIVLVLVCLIGVSWSGLKVYGAEGHGPLAESTIIAPAMAHEDGGREHGPGKSAQEEFWEEIHEFFANMTLFLIIVHICGAIVASHLHHENLVKAMIRGYKKRPDLL